MGDSYEGNRASFKDVNRAVELIECINGHIGALADHAANLSKHSKQLAEVWQGDDSVSYSEAVELDIRTIEMLVDGGIGGYDGICRILTDYIANIEQS